MPASTPGPVATATRTLDTETRHQVVGHRKTLEPASSRADHPRARPRHGACRHPGGVLRTRRSRHGPAPTRRRFLTYHRKRLRQKPMPAAPRRLQLPQRQVTASHPVLHTGRARTSPATSRAPARRSTRATSRRVPPSVRTSSRTRMRAPATRPGAGTDQRPPERPGGDLLAVGPGLTLHGRSLDPLGHGARRDLPQWCDQPAEPRRDLADGIPGPAGRADPRRPASGPADRTPRTRWRGSADGRRTTGRTRPPTTSPVGTCSAGWRGGGRPRGPQPRRPPRSPGPPDGTTGWGTGRARAAPARRPGSRPASARRSGRPTSPATAGRARADRRGPAGLCSCSTAPPCTGHRSIRLSTGRLGCGAGRAHRVCHSRASWPRAQRW